MKKSTIIVGSILIIIPALAFLGTALDFAQFKFWAPKYEDAKREVFEESQSYQHGMIRDLRNLKKEYRLADSESEKRVIKGTFLHRVAPMEKNELPQDLRSFWNELEKQ